MAESNIPQPNKSKAPKEAAKAPRKPLQVLHISRKGEQENLLKGPIESIERSKDKDLALDDTVHPPNRQIISDPISINENNKLEEDITMEDLLNAENLSKPSTPKETNLNQQRSVDDFDFDEDAFLAALNENEPIGNTGEIAKGSVIAVESDGVYVDIGGKAPGFMPKSECGLGVITSIKEKFPKGLQLEVLVTREQNADGMVTISCRALALRKSWEKVQKLEQEGKVVQVKINGFNRGGVTCDLEGLRGFIPRSQLNNGEEYEKLVAKTLGVAFLEVNPETRKLVLSEKRAVIAARFSELKVGQLIEGKISAIKPYGFFVDLGIVSGLLHHSMITGGSIRSLREIFHVGDSLKALITELDAKRGRVGLNTSLLEHQPGEILIEKGKIMAEAEERAKKAQNTLNKESESK
tara:strand:+ start:283 stop:1512 length:1230 start_codon:yes stop_codon:yes gene_type:complete